MLTCTLALQRDEPYHQLGGDWDKAMLDKFYSHLDRQPVLAGMLLHALKGQTPSADHAWVGIKYEDVLNWVPQLLRALQMEVLVLGNYNAEVRCCKWHARTSSPCRPCQTALALAQDTQSTLEKVFSTTGTTLDNRSLPRSYQTPPGLSLFARPAPVVDIHAVSLNFKVGFWQGSALSFVF